MMKDMAIPEWIQWSRRLQAIAQTGLTYAASPYDVERYHEIRDIAVELATAAVGLPDPTIIKSLFEKGDGYATPKVDVRAVVFDGGGAAPAGARARRRLLDAARRLGRRR